MIKQELLELLACPLDDNRPPLHLEGEWLVCAQCGAKFPIKDGIPQLLPENAVRDKGESEKNA